MQLAALSGASDGDSRSGGRRPRPFALCCVKMQLPTHPLLGLGAPVSDVGHARAAHRSPCSGAAQAAAPSAGLPPLGGSACVSAPKDWDGALLPCLSVSGGNRSTKRRLWVAGSQVDFAGSCTYAFHFGAACYW